MTHRVIVWGTGNVGQPAMRAVVSHDDLDLIGVIVSDPSKVGRDAGDLAGIAPVGVSAVTAEDAEELLARADAVVYAASGDFRPVEALADIERALRAGCNVVTTSAYPLQHSAEAPQPLLDWFGPAFEEGGSSVFVSGIDPGWAQDVLPLLLSGVCADIDEIRIQEVFNYETYDAPDAVRDLVGFGTSMDVLPPMLADGAPTTVWGPMLHVMAEGLGVVIDEIREVVERVALDETIELPTMGVFEAGTQGAFQLEVQGIVAGTPRLVIEHVTRIIDDIAPQWEKPAEGKQGAHRVRITGRPNLTVSIEADDGDGNPAGGGNATAANRIVNAIPGVCAAAPGIVTALDLPTMSGRGQLRS